MLKCWLSAEQKKKGDRNNILSAYQPRWWSTLTNGTCASSVRQRTNNSTVSWSKILHKNNKFTEECGRVITYNQRHNWLESSAGKAAMWTSLSHSQTRWQALSRPWTRDSNVQCPPIFRVHKLKPECQINGQHFVVFSSVCWVNCEQKLLALNIFKVLFIIARLTISAFACASMFRLCGIPFILSNVFIFQTDSRHFKSMVGVRIFFVYAIRIFT